MSSIVCALTWQIKFIFFSWAGQCEILCGIIASRTPQSLFDFSIFWGGGGWGTDTLCPYKAHVSPTPIILGVKERSCTEHLPVQPTDVRFSVSIHQMARSDCNSNERSFHLANASENNSRDYASFWLDSWPTPYVLCLRRHQARLAGGGIMLSTCAFVRLFVRSSINKLVNTIVDKIINRFWYKLAHVVHGARARAWNDQLCGSGGQRSRSQEAKIGHKNPFRWDFLRTRRRIITKPDRYVPITHPDARGQGSKSPEAEDRFGGLTDPLASSSFSFFFAARC